VLVKGDDQSSLHLYRQEQKQILQPEATTLVVRMPFQLGARGIRPTKSESSLAISHIPTPAHLTHGILGLKLSLMNVQVDEHAPSNTVVLEF
jgi:hypothetical protein